MFHHARSGLYLTHYRAYDPHLGRWLSRDPLEHGWGLYAHLVSNAMVFDGLIPKDAIEPDGWRNAYGYALGNPLFYTDLFGLDVVVCLYPNAAMRKGHVGIGPLNPNGSPTKGFYPLHTPDRGSKGSIHGPGAVHPDTGSGGVCRRLHSTPRQDACVERCVDQREKNPGTYDLLTRQCTSFVRDCLGQCDIPNGSYEGPYPKPFFYGLGR